MVGTGCFSLSVSRLACLMSKHMQTSPFSFSTLTRGLIQLFGPFTFSITSSATSSSSLSTTFCFLLNGILRMAWATGVSLSSTCSFNQIFFNLLRPVNTWGYFAFRAAFLSVTSLNSQAFSETPTFGTPNYSEELLPSNVSAGPGIMKNSAFMTFVY